MKNISIKSFLFLAVFAILALIFAQVDRAAAQTIGESDPPAPVYMTDLTCEVTASRDYWGYDPIEPYYSWFVDELYIHVEVHNEGPAATNEFFRVTRGISVNGQPVSSLPPYTIYLFLAPGQSTKLPPVHVDLEPASKIHLRAWAIADAGHTIAETQELNNLCMFDYHYQDVR